MHANKPDTFSRANVMQAAPIKASLQFLANVDESLVYIPSKGGGDETEHVGNFTMQEVTIHNGRHHKQVSSLDVEGFRLVSQKTEVEAYKTNKGPFQSHPPPLKRCLAHFASRAPR